MAPRTRRSEETRAATARKAEKREMPAVAFESDLYIPPDIIPDGMAYRWVRLSTHNEPDHTNWGKRTRNGWRPVPRTRHLEVFPFIPMPGHNTDSDMIINGGLILCEKEQRLVNRDKKAREEATRDQMNSIAWTTEGLAGAPKVNESGKVETGHIAFKED